MLLVLVQNGFNHVEPEAHAVLILGAGFVALVEALEQQRDLLGGDGVALVADRDQRLAVERRHAEVERRALAGEFCRIFEQVVDDLRDEVVVAEHHDAAVGNVGVDIEPAVGDLLLHRNEHAAHALAHVERRLRARQVARLELRDLKHAAHEAGQTPRLIRDDAQVLLFLLGRDRAV